MIQFETLVKKINKLQCSELNFSNRKLPSFFIFFTALPHSSGWFTKTTLRSPLIFCCPILWLAGPMNVVCIPILGLWMLPVLLGSTNTSSSMQRRKNPLMRPCLVGVVVEIHRCCANLILFEGLLGCLIYPTTSKGKL